MQSSEEQCLGRPLSIDDVKMSLVIPRGSSASSGVPSSMGIDPLKREKKGTCVQNKHEFLLCLNYCSPLVRSKDSRKKTNS